MEKRYGKKERNKTELNYGNKVDSILLQWQEIAQLSKEEKITTLSVMK